METTWIGCATDNFRKDRPTGMKPEIIVLHSLDGSLVDADTRFNRPAVNLSTHYAVGCTGEIHQYVIETDTAFHAGYVINPTAAFVQARPGINPNFYAIGIEHEGKSGDPLTPAQSAASASLIRDIAARWGIPLDRGHVIAHSEIRASVNCPGSAVNIDTLLAMAPTAKVASPASIAMITLLSTVNLRSSPSVSAPVIRVVPEKTMMVVTGYVAGDSVNNNHFWYMDKDGNYFWAGVTDQPDPQTPFNISTSNNSLKETAGKLLEQSYFESTGWLVHVPNTLALVQGILTKQNEVFSKYGITENIHIVHLMAQISHECGEGKEMTESLNYSSDALLSQWPTHFNQEQANTYGRTSEHPADQKMIGILAYGGRNGNHSAPSEDGYNYRGRGFLQTTGRENYAKIAQLTGLELVISPDLINNPDYAFECAVAEFVSYPGILAHCESDNLLAVSSLINVGHVVYDPKKVIGYKDRMKQLDLWKHQYGLS